MEPMGYDLLEGGMISIYGGLYAQRYIMRGIVGYMIIVNDVLMPKSRRCWAGAVGGRNTLCVEYIEDL